MLAVASVGASAAEPAFDQGIDAGAVLRSLRSSRAQAAPSLGQARSQTASDGQAEWTIMYWINGKNNLVAYVDPDLNHMEEIGSNEHIKIVAEVGKEGAGSVVRRLMQYDEQPTTVTSPVVRDMGAEDMGEWRNLAAFGKWVKANYPAKHYMLSIWNHGSGWLQGRPQGQAAPGEELSKAGISYDDASGNHISTTEMAQALAAMGGVDIYASDACLMQMAEVAYEIRNHAQVILGSEDNEPAVGWNYARYLGPLAADPSMSPAALGRAYTTAFQDSYALLGRTTTISSLDAGTFRDFIPVLDDWTAAMRRADEKSVVLSARRGVQSYSNTDNVDLVDFINRVNEQTRDEGVRTSGTALSSFISGRMVTSNATNGSRVAGSTGLAVYLPTSSFNEEYAQLAWARDSSWPAFARWVLGVVSESTQARARF
ncbi:MAG: hypothetical protein HY928_05120 [Elusimicrobia bacterium]|nr:hypothetical protein [Elusimicrobiota bacterium]